MQSQGKLALQNRREQLEDLGVEIEEQNFEYELPNLADEIDPIKYVWNVKTALLFPWLCTTLFTVFYQIPVWVNHNNSHGNKTYEEDLSSLHSLTFWLYAISFAINAWILHPIMKLPSTQDCGIAFQNIFTSIKNHKKNESGLINDDMDDTTDAELQVYRKTFHKNAELTDDSDLLDTKKPGHRPGYGSISEI